MHTRRRFESTHGGVREREGEEEERKKTSRDSTKAMDTAYADTPLTNKSPQKQQQQHATTEHNTTKDNRHLTTSDERQTKNNERRRATHDMTRHHATNKHKRHTHAHAHVYVHVYVGVTILVHFLTKKTQFGTRTFHDVCCSWPLTFHNGFMFFCFS